MKSSSKNSLAAPILQITLPSLSCELTAIDSVDQIGDRRHDLSGSAIYKMPTGGQVVAVEHAAKTTFVAPVYGNTTDMGAHQPEEARPAAAPAGVMAWEDAAWRPPTNGSAWPRRAQTTTGTTGLRSK